MYNIRRYRVSILHIINYCVLSLESSFKFVKTKRIPDCLQKGILKTQVNEEITLDKLRTKKSILASDYIVA